MQDCQYGRQEKQNPSWKLTDEEKKRVNSTSKLHCPPKEGSKEKVDNSEIIEMHSEK